MHEPSSGAPELAAAFRNDIKPKSYGLLFGDDEAFEPTGRDKSFDPTLGLYAAYAYAQSGNYPEVLSVFRYMRRDPAPVLFDVAMLAAQRARGRFGTRARG